MKSLKYLLLALALCLGANALSSCSLWDDKEADIDPYICVDWVPASLYITAEDNNGKDLLDTLSNSCIVDDITVTFQGETLKVRKNPYREQGGMMPYMAGTRAIMPMWYGLCLINKKAVWDGKQWNQEKTDKFMLYLGEIDASGNHDEDIVFNWGNGKTSTIHYHCSDFIVTKTELSRNLWFSVDGKKQTDNTFKFVL